jgi:hypothetical protein
MKFLVVLLFLTNILTFSVASSAEVPTLKDLACKSIAQDLIPKHRTWDRISGVISKMPLPTELKADLQHCAFKALVSYMHLNHPLAIAGQYGGVISSNKRLHIWGDFTWLNLSLEKKENGLYRVLGEFKDLPLKSIRSEANGILFLDESGMAYFRFEPLPIREKILSFHGGNEFWLAMSAHGKVYSRSMDKFNLWGQLGNGTTIAPETAQMIEGELKDKKVVAIAAGSKHGLALDDEGAVYEWGSNEAVGLSTPSDQGDLLSPKKLSGPWGQKRLISIYSNYFSSTNLAIDEFGTLYGWGSNKFGQLGQGEWTGSERALPHRIEGPWKQDPVDGDAF